MDGVSRSVVFVAGHRPQLTVSGVPEIYWSVLAKKLEDQIFDAGEAFSLLLVDYEDEERQPCDPIWAVQVIRENGISTADPSQIYLIDHAWTFKSDLARRQLRQVPGLLHRMCNLVGIPWPEDINAAERNELADRVHSEIWKYAQFYSLAGDEAAAAVEDPTPVWYVMDELGSGVQHSDAPNFRCVPFVHLPERVCYSLLFPVRNAKEGDLVTRNFIESLNVDDASRQAMLLPWQGFDVEIDWNLPQEEPPPEYFLSGHIEETLPDRNIAVPSLNRSRSIKVFSEYARINENLTRPEFEIVPDEATADVLWYMSHFKHYKEFREQSPAKFVNQFPFEHVITIKDLLAVVSRRKSTNHGPAWLPKTFNLRTELVRFIAYYRHRESAGLENHWICKPFNLARGMDTHITDNLNFITRLPLTGPKIVQKYIDRPVLFLRGDLGERVKFDVRYVILLKSVQPLRVYAYRNFFLRFANKPFAMSDFDEYERHFTVMNYTENAPLFRMLCADFVDEWARQHPDFSWSSVEESIFGMFRELFECATETPPPCSIAPSEQSRALYAADIMLAWDKDEKENDIIQPKLLEMNWMPDCNRACQYYPDFYNDIFSLFFLDQEPDTCHPL